MNGELFRHGPVFEDCPVLSRVAVAGVPEEPCLSELECNPPSLLYHRRGSARSSELRSLPSIPSLTAICASAVLRWLTHPSASMSAYSPSTFALPMRLLSLASGAPPPPAADYSRLVQPRYSPPMCCRWRSRNFAAIGLTFTFSWSIAHLRPSSPWCSPGRSTWVCASCINPLLDCGACPVSLLPDGGPCRHGPGISSRLHNLVRAERGKTDSARPCERDSAACEQASRAIGNSRSE